MRLGLSSPAGVEVKAGGRQQARVVDLSSMKMEVSLCRCVMFEPTHVIVAVLLSHTHVL